LKSVWNLIGFGALLIGAKDQIFRPRKMPALANASLKVLIGTKSKTLLFSPREGINTLLSGTDMRNEK